MTLHRYAALIALCVVSLAPAGCARHDAPAAPSAAQAAADGATPASGSAPVPAEIPQGFSSYASESIGDNKQCVAGASRDEDGMNQRPVAYLAETSGKPIWTKTLDLPADTYQSRATHCVREGKAIYVLLQSDTRPEQNLSQTLLKVVKLNLADGAVLGSGDVVVPGAQGAYSAFVEEGAQHLSWNDGGLRIAGQYFSLDAPDRRSDFQAVLKPDLSQ
ncbi:hypothetical protein [Lysobacter sp. CA199]|uniref:hypothetical protein n=1 Tax=Lysobacter sp. CA199 TaxID=3455608 RepID=UPI003F8D3820